MAQPDRDPKVNALEDLRSVEKAKYYMHVCHAYNA